MTKEKVAKKDLINDQNKSLIMICVIIIVIIAVVTVFLAISSKGNDKTSGSGISSDGVVNDLDAFKKK